MWAVTSVGDANNYNRSDDISDHAATQRGEVRWLVSESTHAATLQAFVMLRNKPVLGFYAHLQSRPDRLLLRFRRGPRSAELLQTGAAGKAEVNVEPLGTI